MTTPPQVQTLIQKEITRKEFLGLAALAVGSIFGFGQIVKLFTGKSLSNHPSFRGSNGQGYGK
jgi:hypothetical protein